MNYTNLQNLPQPLVSAIIHSDYESVGDISATGLVLPPRIYQLLKRHDNEITQDVSEGIWRLIGSVGHKILERADTDNHLSEERLTTVAAGWTVSGKADLLGPDMTLDDYKFTSVWAMKGLKPEWEAQLNIYALLYRENGFTVKAARIIAILKDWSKARAKREPDYPQVGVVVKEVPLWSQLQQWNYLQDRISLHQDAVWKDDDELPLCTDEERWKKPDIWAVKKKGNKRALRVFDDKTLAEMWFDVRRASDRKTPLEIEHRPGSYPRCESYCAVKEFCSFGKTLMANEDPQAQPES